MNKTLFQKRSRNIAPVGALLSATLLIGLVMVAPFTTRAAGTPTLTANQTVANVAVGAHDDQTAVTALTQPNAAEVKASRTLTVNSLPVASTTSTIGSCVITYSTSVADSLNCSGNAAILNVTTHNATSTLAGAMRTLTNVSATGHGALTITGTGNTAIFTTTGTEASATAIGFTDGTSGAVTSTASTTGVIPSVQINTVTIGGTVETGDIYTVTIPTVGAVNYTVASTTTTTAQIANALRTAVVASAGYAGQAFTAATSTNTVIFTAKAAGTGFTQTSSAANYPGVAQVVTFTPGNLQDGNYQYTIDINGSSYSDRETASTAKAIVEALQAEVDEDSAVSCTEDDSVLTCTSEAAGTSFTYATNVGPYSNSSGGGSSSHHSSGGSSSSSSSSSDSSTTTTGATTVITTSTTLDSQLASLLAQLAALKAQMGMGGATATAGTSASFTRDLTIGDTGADVMALQVWLNAHGFMVASAGAVGSMGHETTTFGPATQAALAKYQASVGISPAAGYFGPKTRAAIQ